MSYYVKGRAGFLSIDVEVATASETRSREHCAGPGCGRGNSQAWGGSQEGQLLCRTMATGVWDSWPEEQAGFIGVGRTRMNTSLWSWVLRNWPHQVLYRSVQVYQHKQSERVMAVTCSSCEAGNPCSPLIVFANILTLGNKQHHH